MAANQAEAVTWYRRAAEQNDAWAQSDTTAYAETGQFEKAVATQVEAIAHLQTEEDKTPFRARLRLYEAKRPYRGMD